MPLYRVHMINSEFESSDEGEYTSVNAAMAAGIGAAVKVASEAIARGELTSAVEIRVEQGDEIAQRRVLSFSVSELAIGE